MNVIMISWLTGAISKRNEYFDFYYFSGGM